MRVYALLLVIASLLISGCASSSAVNAHRQQDHGERVVSAAKDSLGTPYRRGGTSDIGYDCSGFVQAMYLHHAGVSLPRRSTDQAAATKRIKREELRPGDLVFFNTLNRAYSHVGIYVGDYQFIHSPSSGGKVRIEDMRKGYWNKRFNGARRVAAGVM